MVCRKRKAEFLFQSDRGLERGAAGSIAQERAAFHPPAQPASPGGNPMAAAHPGRPRHPDPANAGVAHPMFMAIGDQSPLLVGICADAV
jgi:hypothetical protein